MDDLISLYNKDGYCVLNVFKENEFLELQNFTNNWIKKVISTKSGFNVDARSLSDYHKWGVELGIKHEGLFSANNRYIDPPESIIKILHNERITLFLSKLHGGGYKQWADPGLGWFGYRLIRPGMGDGYPTSCKNWGAAAGVISLWVPIIGFSQHETLSFVPGSHLKNYKNYLPEDSKFTKGELRLKDYIDPKNYSRIELHEGEAIIYHPALLHTENVESGDSTRINLEYRFMPL